MDKREFIRLKPNINFIAPDTKTPTKPKARSVGAKVNWNRGGRPKTCPRCQSRVSFRSLEDENERSCFICGHAIYPTAPTTIKLASDSAYW